MVSTFQSLRVLSSGARASVLIFLFFATAGVSLAQSIDVRSPSPIRSGEVVGSIVARDLGDSRVTDHFYAFTGTPGDVVVTVKSSNLNGDVDLFTAGSLRPLMKFSLYAENSSPATRAVFLRKREDLILRVEARSPNDDEGTYQITLGGSFEPLAGNGSLSEENSSTSESAPAEAARSKGSRRVSSVGARIAEPPEVRTEVATAPPSQPTPENSVVPTPTSEPTATTEAPATAPAARRRARVPPTRRRPTPQPAKKTEPSTAETANTETPSEVPKAETPAPATRRPAKRTAVNRPAEQIPVPEPQTGPRLVLQMQDGTLVERFMSTIRRVTVENNQIVVVGKDGRIERTRMSDVLRMAIEP